MRERKAIRKTGLAGRDVAFIRRKAAMGLRTQVQGTRIFVALKQSSNAYAVGAVVRHRPRGKQKPGALDLIQGPYGPRRVPGLDVIQGLCGQAAVAAR